jgi:hypothetical protein
MKLTEAMHKINAAINRQPPAPEVRRRSVFVSYESTDRGTAAELVAGLEAAGFAPWWAGALAGGEHFRDAIVRALDAAHAAVVIWSAASVRSVWVEAEAARAFEQHKLVPVRLGDLDLRVIPPPFGALHTLSLEDRTGLIRAIERVAAAESRGQAPSR